MRDEQNAAGRDAREAIARGLFRAGAAYPFLREPIEGLERVPDPSVARVATDGVRLFYRPDGTPGEADVEHLLIHCLFRHLPPPENAIGPLWDLACDMSAEFLRAELFPAKDGKLIQLTVADALPEGVDPRVAGAVYGALMNLFEDETDELADRFCRDDHRYWHAPPPLWSPVSPGGGRREGGGSHPSQGNGRAYREWMEDALESLWPGEDELPGGLSKTGRYGLSPGSRQERMLLRAEGKYDFSRYLRRFSTTREELRLDLSGFDYIPYYYGLMRYGSMPLIEPLEYAESHRVETLVIAIDTSGSCKRPTVERFLAEIERMLMAHEYFFTRMNVHIMQCDAMVQSDVAIHSYDEWKQYSKDLTIKGRSGTDFRPVFKRVAQLQAKGALKNLKGLLYFTDGDGAYPQQKPPYETAFVFSTRGALERKLPEWIIPLCLERPDDEER